MNHGARHPGMPKRLKICFIFTCDISFCKSPEDCKKLVTAERKFINDPVRKILELKRKVCTDVNKKTFELINRKGVDLLSLGTLAKEGVMAFY